VFREKHQEAEWLDMDMSLDDVTDSLGEYNRNRDHKYGMKTARLGIDTNSNEFYLLDLQEACNMVQLLVSHAYVTFGEAVYHQTKGIPMGINPAVFMANYYLFYYEYLFI
jgi:hypothetical protein